MIRVERNMFLGKQNIAWRPDVEEYLHRYVNASFVVKETQDVITIPKEFPDEYTGSQYTKKLRGGLAKTKANIAQVIGLLIESAQNKRIIENKDIKHEKDAPMGWMRYDVFFEIGVRAEDECEIRWNLHRATLVVRMTAKENYLYDIVNIKKEARRPLKS